MGVWKGMRNTNSIFPCPMKAGGQRSGREGTKVLNKLHHLPQALEKMSLITSFRKFEIRFIIIGLFF